MRQRALWLASITLSACYFGPDKHDSEDVTTSGAGASDAQVTAPDGEHDAAADAYVEVEVDAGCQSDLDCPLAFPQCLQGNCVPCSEPNDCSRFADTPICGPSGACVVCTADHAQLCTGATPACNPTTNGCVQCVLDGDCPTEAQAACNTTSHTCSPCTTDAQCTRFSKVCDAKSGACVQCRPETETMDCTSGTACNPKTLTCGTRPRGSVTLCNQCDSDSECVTDNRCIPMVFGDAKQAVGNFCLKRFSTGCVRGYQEPISRASVSGAAADQYCGVNETRTSCAAVAAAKASKSCTSDESCGAPGARCETVSGLPNICTYSCEVAADCVASSYLCGGPAGEEYCGAN